MTLLISVTLLVCSQSLLAGARADGAADLPHEPEARGALRRDPRAERAQSAPATRRARGTLRECFR